MLLQRLGHQLQIDKPLAYALAARGWQAISGPITIIFLVQSLSLPQQGAYYTLVSILGIQMFFELGLLNILISQAGNLVTKLSSAHGAAQMRELIQASQRWFIGASSLFTLAALALGWTTLTSKTTISDWHMPLVGIVLASATTVALSPRLAILEGAGFREDVYRIRFFQMLSGSLAVWLSLAAGLELWALVVSTCVQLLWTAYLPLVRHADFFSQFMGQPANHAGQNHSSFSWARDVLPVQWRFALISAGNHFATQLFTVLVMWFHSPQEAGRLGMTLSISQAIQALASAWIYTKYSLVSAEHGAGNREAAGNLWRQTAVISTSLLISAFAFAAVILALLPFAQLGLEQRFITPLQFVVLSIGCTSMHLLGLQGFYVLSQRARPLLLASLVGLGSIALFVWSGGYLYSISGVVWGYALASLCCALPLHTWAYLKFRREVLQAI